jgi:hypothetical protein
MEGSRVRKEVCVWLGYYTAQSPRQYTAFGHVYMNDHQGGAGEVLCDKVQCEALY